MLVDLKPQNDYLGNHDDSITYSVYCIVCMLHEALMRSSSLQTPTSTSASQPASHAMPCHPARPIVRDALTSCSCMMHPVLEQPWRSGGRAEHKMHARGLQNGRTCRQRLRARRLCRRLSVSDLSGGNGKWEVEGERISRYRAGRSGTESGDERWHANHRRDMLFWLGGKSIEGVGMSGVCLPRCHMQAVCNSVGLC
jgi:hypothetical protein